MDTTKVNNPEDDFKSIDGYESPVTNFNDLMPEAILQRCVRASALVGHVIHTCSYETAAQLSGLLRENMILQRKMEEIRKQLTIISGVNENDWLRFLHGLDWMKIQGIPIADRLNILYKNIEDQYINNEPK